MTNDEIKKIAFDEELSKGFFENLLCYGGQYYLQASYEVDDYASFKVLPIDNAIIENIKKYFFGFRVISEAENLDNKTMLALPTDIFNELHSLCNQYELKEFESHMGVIIYIANIEKLGKKGKKPLIEENLLKLKDYLSSSVLNKKHSAETVGVEGQYLLKKVSIEFENIKNHKPETVIFKGDEFESHKIHFLMQAILSRFIDLSNISENQVIKSNTNALFCHSFYNFIDQETPYSYFSSKVTKADILRLFIKIYKLAGYEFKGNKAKLDDKDELDISETWLKSFAN